MLEGKWGERGEGMHCVRWCDKGERKGKDRDLEERDGCSVSIYTCIHICLHLLAAYVNSYIET